MNTLITFALSVVFVVSCAPSTKVEIEPGESVELIIVEPQKETPKNLWNWKAREELRRENKEDEE